MEYDLVGNLLRQSLPTYATAKPTATNQWTTYTYYGSGDIKTSSDPWSLVTTYGYDQSGKQTSRTLKSTTDDATRSQGWSYYPDGSLKTRSDTAAQQPVKVIDNGDSYDTSLTGT